MYVYLANKTDTDEYFSYDSTFFGYVYIQYYLGEKY